ncbi:hypothetical protein AYL99_05175 [Fonsecaea erecta]|uniref:Uncharacterized protein n=1 Tax=Fonsecaea erecta TaxID=1367422 RepID=A0A178ZLT1_9EURO|nr:hypothetical protein AYL99_05175 [Fonsecaea erecta]OAP60173.1 hypothetical protein AYL99_05175 [Fonsecaea erecta]
MDTIRHYAIELAVRISIKVLECIWDHILANVWFTTIVGWLVLLTCLSGTDESVWGAIKRAQVRRATCLIALQSLRLLTFLFALLSAIDVLALYDNILKPGDTAEHATADRLDDGPAPSVSRPTPTPHKFTCLGIVASAASGDLRCKRTVKRQSATVEGYYCDKHRDQGYARLDIWAAAAGRAEFEGRVYEEREGRDTES